jgi:transcriptional regulator with XRE-family HTH domain
LDSQIVTRVDKEGEGMNQSELARKLGVTRQAISKLARRGMPIDSIEAANKWRLVHAPPRKTFVAAVADKAETPFAAAQPHSKSLARYCPVNWCKARSSD